MASSILLTEDEKEFIRKYVAEAPNKEESKRRRKECAEEFCVSVPTIAAITAWTTIRNNNKRELQTNPITAITNNKREEQKTVLQTKPIEIPITEEVAGCNANYDNPVKQLWREKWKNFLLKNTFQERENLTVLCLPGKQCLEIPLYLEIGFKPENITGVEGGDEQTRREFVVNADKYGITTKLGRLENIITKEKTSYDVVSLDFTGPMCRTYLDIIKDLPIKPDVNSQFNTRSLFMINVMGKREQQVTQDLMEYYSFFTHSKVQDAIHDVHNRLKDGVDLMVVRDFINVSNIFTQLENDIKSGKEISDRELTEKRDSALPFMISSLIASTKWHNNPLYMSYFQKFYELKVEGIDCGNIFSQVMCHIIKFLRKIASEKFLILLATGIGEIVQMTTNFRPFVMDIEEYSYVSPVNNSNSPFLTEMMALYTPLADYAKMRHVIKFMFDTVIWVAENGQDGAYIGLRNKKGLLKPKGSSLARGDILEFTTADRRSITSISIHKMLQADEVMAEVVGKDKLADVILGKQTFNRIDLNNEVKWESPLND
jgi:hypothetical protein